MTGRDDCHSFVEYNNSEHVIMESRTFRIRPIKYDVENEATCILGKNSCKSFPHQSNFDYNCNDEDDAMAIAVPRSVSLSSHARNLWDDQSMISQIASSSMHTQSLFNNHVMGSPIASSSMHTRSLCDDQSMASHTVSSRSHNRSMFEDHSMVSHKSRGSHSCHSRLGFGTMDAKSSPRYQNKRGFGTIDCRNDKPSSSILHGSNQNEHISPRRHKQPPHKQIFRRTSIETEKRIAKLRNAGLSVSSKGDMETPSLLAMRSTTPKGSEFQKWQKEEVRDPPSPTPAVGSKRLFLHKDRNWHGLESKSNSLRDLLEKDERNRQRVVETQSQRKPSLPLVKSFNCGNSSTKDSTHRTQRRTNPLPRHLPMDTVDPIITAQPDCSGSQVLKDHQRVEELLPQPRRPHALTNRLDPILGVEHQITNRTGGSALKCIQGRPALRSDGLLHPSSSMEDDTDPIIAPRPAYRGLRVSRDTYPDPQDFGWTFVGSCWERRIECFEKDFGENGIVVLEFHYATGTVRVTLEHPFLGSSLLAFARGESRVSSSGLSQKIYRKILIDPLGGCNGSMKLAASVFDSGTSASLIPSEDLDRIM